MFEIIELMNISQIPEDEPWEVSYGYIGQDPRAIQCASEESADAVSREIQISFGSTSNWNISATRVGARG